MASHYNPNMDANRSYVTARTRDASLAGDAHTVGGGSVACSIAPPPGAMAQPQPAPYPSFIKICGCIEIYKPRREVLEYDYTYDDVSGKKPPQSYPRIRERGEFYIDSYNGEAWSCSFGTAEKVRLWREYEYTQRRKESTHQVLVYRSVDSIESTLVRLDLLCLCFVSLTHCSFHDQLTERYLVQFF